MSPSQMSRQDITLRKPLPTSRTHILHLHCMVRSRCSIRLNSWPQENIGQM